MVKNMLNFCCPKSKIDYGRDFDGIESIDRMAQDGGDIDIYFPLYGLSFAIWRAFLVIKNRQSLFRNFVRPFVRSFIPSDEIYNGFDEVGRIPKTST